MIYEHDCRHGPILLDQADADWVLETYYLHITIPRDTYFGPYYQTMASLKEGMKTGRREGRILARLLLKPSSRKLYVDHINHDGRDNRRENLRIVTAGQNNSNSRAVSSSGYRGVQPDPRKDRWYGRVGFQGQQYRGPYRRMAHLAALDYNRMIIALYGRQMLLNEVPCYAEYPLPSDTNCLFCNAPCLCCCVCGDVPSAGMARLLKLAESASVLSI